MIEEANKRLFTIEHGMKLIQERNAAIAAFIETHGEACFEAPCGLSADRFLIVHCCTYPEYQGKWQASFFDADGASGHMLGGDYKKLIKDLIIFYKLDLGRISRIEKPLQREVRSLEDGP
jgi:hypothetical protein